MSNLSLLPREKLLRLGPQFLSDAELLAIFLRTGIKGKSALVLATDIAQKGPVAVRYVKQSVDSTDRLDLDSGLAMEASLFGLCFATNDQKEGMQAFIEKRPADFTGT